MFPTEREHLINLVYIDLFICLSCFCITLLSIFEYIHQQTFLLNKQNGLISIRILHLLIFLKQKSMYPICVFLMEEIVLRTLIGQFYYVSVVAQIIVQYEKNIFEASFTKKPLKYAN